MVPYICRRCQAVLGYVEDGVLVTGLPVTVDGGAGDGIRRRLNRRLARPGANSVLIESEFVPALPE